MNAYLIEALGTFFLVMTIALSGEPIAIGMVLASLVYMGGAISGGHYNPAVSLGMFLRKKLTPQKFLVYCIAQLIGASVAVLALEKLFTVPFTVAPGVGVSWMTACTAEVLFTFLLVSVVLHSAASRKTQGNQYFGLAIGGVVIAAAYSIGTISGGALNPAVGLAPIFTNFLVNGAQFDVSLLFLYTTGPFLGAILASYLHELTQREGK